jgi:hypothetical protein
VKESYNNKPVYAKPAASRSQSLDQVDEKTGQVSNQSMPSSTYHSISGLDLRNEIFFKQKNGSQEYLDYKELMLMYQAEIKKRWDNKASIKEAYIFPRVQPQIQNINVSFPPSSNNELLKSDTKDPHSSGTTQHPSAKPVSYKQPKYNQSNPSLNENHVTKHSRNLGVSLVLS